MKMNLKLCCIKLSIATRVIAMVGLIAAVLVLVQLASDLFEGKDGSESTVSILLGLDIEEFTYISPQDLQNRQFEITIAFIAFALIHALASAILVWGSIVEQSWCAIPWLICEAITFLAQVFTLSIHSIKFGIQVRSDRDEWLILLLVANMCLSVYFWIVVFSARKAWARKQREAKENETNSTASSSHTVQDELEAESVAPALPDKAPVQGALMKFLKRFAMYCEGTDKKLPSACKV